MKKEPTEAVFEAVEPRILFSADGVGAMAVDIAEPMPEEPAIEASLHENDAQTDQNQVQENDSLLSDSQLRTELVFVDPNVEGYDDLLDDLLANGQDRNFEIHMLDEGIEDITTALQGVSDVSAIHILAHGDAGEIQIGGTTITNDSFNEFNETLSSWSDSLNQDADILFYGCNVAGSDNGQQLLGRIAAATGADIGASDDLTGHVDEGGDWILEYKHGVLETEIAISDQGQSDFQGVLDITTGLVAHYDFEEGSGDAVNDIAVGDAVDDEGDLEGSTEPVFTTGHIGSHALDFSAASDDKVVINDSADLDFGSGDFTVSAWFNTGSVSGSERIIGKLNNGSQPGFVIYNDNFGDTNFMVSDGSNSINIWGSGYHDNAWHQVTAIRNGNNFQLYIDNVLVDSTTQSLGSVNNNEDLLFGISSGNTSNYDGRLDEVRLYDRALNSSDRTELYNYVGSNDAPVQSSIEGSTLSYTEDDGSVAVTSSLALSDSDDSNLESAVIQITGNYVNGEDVLSFADQNGISGSWNATTGTLTLTGTSSVANYQTALRSIAYTNNSQDPDTGTRTISFTINDGDDNSNTVTRNISVAAVDQAPSDISTSTTTDGGLTINTDGGNDVYLQADNGGTIFDGMQEFTIEAQISLDGVTGKNTILSYETAAGGNDVLLWFTTPGELQLQVNGGGNSVNAGVNISEINDGQPHTISVSWDSTNGAWAFYVDGEAKNSGTGLATGHSIDAGGTLVLGQEQDGVGTGFDSSEAFQGTFHDVRIFDDVRTANEINVNYNTALPHNEQGLMANWQFNSLATDQNGNQTIVDNLIGNNLTVLHASGAGYTASNPSLTFSVNEYALDGTVVGSVAGIDEERNAQIDALLAADSDLIYSAETGKFYKHFQTNVNFSTAQSNAISEQLNGTNGQLITIGSIEDQLIAETMAASGNRDVWLGASDSSVEGQWRWLDGTSDAEQFWQGDENGYATDNAYTNWRAGKPDSGSGNEDAVALRDEDGQWDDNQATVNNHYIVEWNADDVLDQTQALSYSIQSQTESGAFAINNDTGVITVADGSVLDYETNATHTLNIRVQDADGLTFDKAFTINLNNLVEDNTAPTNLSSGIELNTDGGNDAYLVNTDAGTVLNGLSEFTFETTFASENLASDETALISYATATNDNEILMNFQSDGRFGVAIAGEVFFTTESYSHLFDGEPHSVALSWDNTNGDVVIYVDGEIVHTHTSIGEGQTIDGGTSNGTIVFGNEQDSLGGSFANDEVFEGTLYDVRLWNEVRSEAEIALNYQNKFNTGSLPTGLIANWQMDGFNGSNEVVDVVSGNNLSIGHATGAGFITSTPVGDLNIDENAADGTSVGFVIPSEININNDLISDGGFLKGDSGSWDPHSQGSIIGDWTVIESWVDHTSQYPSPLGGVGLELERGVGTPPGTIGQTITIEVGKEYQFIFSATGNFSGGDAVKHMRASAGGVSMDYAIEDTGTYETYSFTFTATDTSTDILLQGLRDTGYGAVVSDVRVIEISAAVSTILNNDSSLTYDAATDKFYRHVASSQNWTDANTAAQAAQVNGISGQLVSIRSEYENGVVREILTESGWGTTWIGASDSTTEGSFYWQDSNGDSDQFWSGGVSGSATSDAYANFRTGEPNDNSGQDYVYFSASDGMWDDASNTSATSYIIEWDASEVLSNFTFSMTDTAGGRFAIDQNTGEVTVANASLIDYETNTSHDVTVQVRDATGNTYSESLTIQVDDIADLNLQQTIPGTQNVNEDTVLTFSSGNGNAVSVTDNLGATDTPLQVTLSVNDGVLHLSQLTGITITEGSQGGESIIVEGTESALNAAFEGMTFTPDSNFSGSVTLNMQTALAANLNAHYTFDSGNANDQATGTTHNGTLNGNASIVTDGQRGQVLSLDGSGDYVEITGLIGEPENITLAAWIDATSTDTFGAVAISMGISPALYLEADGRLTGYYESGGTDYTITTTESLLSTGWRHVAVSIDTSTNEMVLYVDGVAYQTLTTPGAIDYDNSPNTFIGRAGDGLGGFDFGGSIDDARIYSRALSADEIKALANDQTTTSNDTVNITVNSVNDAPTFEAGNGVVVNSAATLFDSAVDVAIQPDGKVVVLTSANTASSGQDIDYVLTRYNVDGSLDTSFGSGGSVTTAVNTNNESPKSIALQSDGKILVAGGYTPTVSSDSIIMRYNANGTLDTSFSGDGMSEISFAASASDFIQDMVVQDDGKIVVVGYASISGTEEMVVARLNTDGTLDTSFDTDGTRVLNISANDDRANAVALQDDGKIVIVGQSDNGTDDDLAVVRLNTDGSFDNTFDSDGVSTVGLGGSDFGNAVAIDSSGNILVSGITTSTGSGDSFVLRLTSSGNFDTSFGTGGLFKTGIGSPFEGVNDMALQADGKIVVVGDAYNGSNNDVSIFRLNTNGILDTSFDGDGIVTNNLNGATDSAEAVAIDSDGSIIVVGRTDIGGMGDSFVARYNTDGSSHENFNLVNTLDNNPTFIEDGSAVVLDPNVQIYDAELSTADNYSGASLTLERNGGANTDDDFFFNSGNGLTITGTAIGSPPVISYAIEKNGQDIADFDLTTTPGQLVITFTDANGETPTQADVNNIMQQITYSNSSEGPPSLVRIDWLVNDGNAGAQGSGGARFASGYTDVNITAVANDAISDAHYTTWIGDNEFIVNTETSNNQEDPSVTALSDGGFVVVWESYNQDGSGDGIYFQRYDAAGNAIGVETAVNTTTANEQRNAEVTALSNGGFVIAWESINQDSDGMGVFLRVFDSNGVAVTGEVQANTEETGWQQSPNLAALNGGGFIVTWASQNQDGDEDGVYFQRFNNAGVAQGVETRANTTTSGDQDNPGITSLNDGGFVILWEDHSTGDNEVMGQRFDALGSTVGSEFQVNTTTADDQEDPEVVALTGGGFVAVWEASGQDGDGEGVYAQRFDATGSAVGGEFIVNSYTAGEQQDARITALNDGGFLVVWESFSDQDGSSSGSYAQQFDASGNRVNGEFQLNTTTLSSQQNPNVTQLSDGRIIAVWESSNQDGSDDAVIGRIFSESLIEHAPVGTVAAVASQFVDVDEVYSYTFSLTDDAGGAFDINTSTGTITVLDPSLIDYETATSMNVTVRVTDAAAGAFHDEVVSIAIKNIAEAEHTIPGAQNVNEDEVLTFSTGNGNAVTVTDTLTSTDALMQVTLSANDGLLTLSQTTGLTFDNGTNGTSTFTFSGTESDINAALEGMTFTPNANFNGAVTLNVTTELAANLDGYYTFEGGNANDQSAGTPNNGTFIGDATTITDVDRGEVLSLDGTGDFVEISGTFDNPNTITIGGWVNFNSAGRAEFISLDDRVHIALDDGGLGVKGSIQTGAASWNDLNSGISLSGTGWNHVMYTFDDTNDVHTLYINGEIVATETITDSVYWTGATDTYIGQHHTGAFNLNGMVDDVRIYDRAISAEEIQSLASTQNFAVSDSVSITVNAVNDAPTFAIGDGSVSTTQAGVYDYGTAMTTQPDGKILVVGHTDNGSGRDLFLARYNEDGSLDTTFSGDGLLALDAGTGDNFGTGVTVQPDGKILVTGYNQNGGNTDFTLARYNADGTVDSSFGTSGVVGTDFGGNDQAYSVSVQQDGKIVVAGHANDGSNNNFALARYNTDGSLDTSFSGDGLAMFKEGSFDYNGQDLHLLDNGQILIVGKAGTGSGNTFGMMRVNSDGTLDTSFDGDGILTTNIAGITNDNALAVAVQSDGKIILGGFGNNGSDNDIILVRYNANGSLDTTFDGDGVLTTDVSGTNDLLLELAIQDDGKIVVVGASNNGSDDDYAILRYNSNGSLDTTFDGDGILTFGGSGYQSFEGISLGNNGDIIAVGASAASGNFEITLHRFNSEGSTSLTFDPQNTLDGNPTFVEDGAAVTLDADVSIFDAELSGIDDFGGATLVLERNGGGNADDVFSATGNLVFNAGTLELSSSNIGTVTNTGGTLTLTFAAGTTNAQVNEVMQSIQYANSSDAPPASVQIDWTFNDGNAGAQGSGGALQATGSTTVNIVDVSSPANIVVPIAQSVDEDTPLTFSSGGGNTITVDTGSSYDPTITVTLSVNDGDLTLAGTTGITFLDGTSDGDGTLTIAGTEFAINTALDGLQYQGNQDYNGSDALTVTTGSSVAVEANLHARYEFLNGSLEDETTNNYDGIANGGPSLTNDPERGDVLTFDGDDKVDITNSVSTLGDQVTIAGWVNLDAGQQDNVFLSIGDEFYVMLDKSNPSVSMGLHVSNFSTSSLSSTHNIAGEGWNHVAATFNDVTKETNLYLNGELVRSSSYSFSDVDWSSPDSPNITLGAMSDGSNAFTGSLDDIRVYNSELNRSEIIGVMGDNGYDSETVNVTVNSVNDEQVLATNTGATVAEGSTGNIVTTAMLHTTDVDDVDSDLTYTLDSAPANGTLYRNGVALGVSDSFKQADIDAGIITYNHDGSQTSADSFDFTVDDGEGTTISDTFNWTVTNVNDAPVLNTNPGGGTYNENTTPNHVDFSATVTDADLTDFDGGTLTVTLTNNGTANDRLVVIHEGTGAGELEVTGSNLLINSVVIGSFTGGNGVGDPLIVTFNSQADATAVTKVAQYAGYENVSDDPSTLQRQISMQVTDGDGGTSAAGVRSMNVIAHNDVPVLVTDSGTLNYTENDTATIISPGITVTDPDSADYDGGVLSVQVTGNPAAEDRLYIQHVGNNPGEVSIGGGNVSYSGTVVGTYSSAAGGAPLTVTFNSNADQAAVEAIAQSIQYFNVSEDPSANTRTVSFTLTDGDGGTSATETRDIAITPVNDLPGIDLNGADGAGVNFAATYTEGNAAVLVVDTDALIGDTDNNSYQNLTISLGGFVDGASERIWINGNSFDYGSANLLNTTIGSTTFDLTFTGSAFTITNQSAGNIPEADLIGLLRSVAYENTSADPTISARTFTFNVTDSDGGTSSTPAVSTISISGINTAPSGSDGTVTTNEDTDYIFTSSDFGFTDTDGNTFTNVIITTVPTNGVLYLDSNSDGIVDGGETISATDTVSVSDITSGLLKFKAVANANGVAYDSFTFQVQDDGGTANGGVDTDQTPNTITVDVTAVNDAAVVNINNTDLNFTEQSPVGIAVGATITDDDDTDLESMTVRFTVGYENGVDSFNWTPHVGISGNWDSATGTLTFTGTATVADYQSLLRTITFVNNSDNPDTTTRTFEVFVNDGGVNSTAETRNIIINRVNDNPVFDLDADDSSGGATGNHLASFTEGDSPVSVIDSDVSITDVDNTTMERVAMIGQFNGSSDIGEEIYSIGGEQFVIGTARNTTVTVGTTTFELDFDGSALDINLDSGSGVISDFEGLLATMTYEHTGDNPTTGVRSFSLLVTDADSGSSNTVTSVINVSAVNDPPVVDLNGSDGAGLNYSDTFTEGGGAVNVTDSDATVSDPDDVNFSSIGVNILGASDGTAEEITIGGYTFQYGVAEVVNRTVGGTDFELDFDGSGFTIAEVSSGNIPQADADALIRSIQYENTSSDPTAGNRTFDISIQDTSGLNSASSFSTITVAAVNDAPVITINTTGAAFTENMGGVFIDAAATVADVDSINFDTGVLTFNLSANGTTSDQLYIQPLGTGPGEVSLSGSDIIIDSVVVGSFSGGTAGTNLVITFNANADATDVQAVTQRVAYSNNSEDPSTLTRTVEVTLTDGDGGTSNTGTRNIDINAINDEQTLDNNTGDTVSEGSTGNIITNVMLQTSDVDNSNAELIYTVDTIPLNGTLFNNGTALSATDTFTQADINAGLITYNHDGSQTSADSFDFTVDDGAGTVISDTFNWIVTNVNDATSIFGIEGTNLNYTENDGATLVTSTLTLSDVDDTHLESAVVQITSNYVNGEDILSFVDQNGISGTWDAATGTLTLTGTATIADYQTALRSITYSNNSDAPDINTRTVSFTVNDGDSNSNTQTRDIDITAVNDDPVIAFVGGNISYTENDPATIIDNSTTLTDIDLVDFNGGVLSVYFSANGSGNDRLAINDEGMSAGEVGVTAGPNEIYYGGTLIGNWSGSGAPLSITFNSNADAAAVEAVMQNITYQNLSDDPSSLTRTIEMQLTDGDGGSSNIISKDVIFTVVNDAPTIANNTGATVAEGSANNIVTTAMLNESDPDDDGAELTYTVISVPVNGTLYNNGTALNASDTFTQADIDAGLITYTHNGGETTADSFNFILADGGEDGVPAALGTFNFTITPINDAPIVTTNTGTTANEGSINNTITNAMLNEGDVDDGGAGITYTVTSLTNHGTLYNNGTALGLNDTFSQADIDAGLVTYNHNGSENFTDSFGFRLSDGGEDGAGTVDDIFNITITPVNDPPVANDDSGSVNEGGTVTINLMGNDTDVDNAIDPSSITIVGGPSNGSIVINGDGTVDYTHDGSETMADAFAYTIRDVSGQVSNTATVTLSINPVNDAPIANSDNANVNEGGSIIIDLLVNDSDAEGPLDPNSVDILITPSHGILINNNDGTVEYFHDGSETTLDNFTYTVRDITGVISNSTTVNITINPINDAPDILQNELRFISGTTTAMDSSAILATDVDTLDTNLTFTASLVSNGQFEEVANPGIAINNFTQQQINDGEIQFVHFGGAAPFYELTVSDGSLTDGPIVVSLTQIIPTGDPDNPILINIEATPPDFGGPDVVSITLQFDGPDDNRIELKFTRPVSSDAVDSSSGGPNSRSDTTVETLSFASDGSSYNQGDTGQSLTARLFTHFSDLRDVGLEKLNGSGLFRGNHDMPVSFDQALKDFRREMELSEESQNSTVKFAADVGKTLGLSLSVGSLTWLLRIEWLFSVMLSSMPAWRSFDPLPVLAASGTTKRDDDDLTEEEYLERLRNEEQDKEIEYNASLILDSLEQEDMIEEISKIQDTQQQQQTQLASDHKPAANDDA